MIQVNCNKWKIYDPDSILSYELDEFDPSILKSGADIHPREDMVQFTHIDSNYVADFGYYGCGIKLDGFYAIYVIDGNLEEAWSKSGSLGSSVVLLVSAFKLTTKQQRQVCKLLILISFKCWSFTEQKPNHGNS